MKLWGHMKFLSNIRVLALVSGVLYWRPQIPSAQSAASDVQNGGIERTVYISTPVAIDRSYLTLRKSLRSILRVLERVTQQNRERLDLTD